MRYKPSRDIPKAVGELKTLSPTKIVEWVREHRKEKDAFGKYKQVDRSPQSVSHWFERNPEAYKGLKQELQDSELPKRAISEAIFENGVFYEVPCIASWVRDLTNRGAKPSVIKRWVNMIKRVCKGNLRLKPFEENIEKWGLKHPKMLSLEDAKNFIYEVKKHGVRSREWRLALRSFLASKNIVVKPTDISGALEADAGKYADLYVSKEKLTMILNWLKNMNYEAYLASLFAFKTGCRLTASLEAHSKYINCEEHKISVFEKATNGKGKRKIIKYIPSDLWELIKDLNGRLFHIGAMELNNLLRRAYKEVIPKVEERIEMPFHFWRHMFAQHMLRAKEWNYTIVAKLGGWSTQALERYYGKMNVETAFNLGKQSIENL